MAQVVEHLSGKSKALSSNPSTEKKKSIPVYILIAQKSLSSQVCL
jgi:hypothetical protein